MLKQSLNKLSAHLLPWKQLRLEGEVTTFDFIEMVDAMMVEDKTNVKEVKQVRGQT